MLSAVTRERPCDSAQVERGTEAGMEL
jgi:hypothetical protein